jgi:GDP-L-fucose synthase
MPDATRCAHRKVIERTSIMNKSARIFVAGHRGLAGSAILRRLQELGYERLITRTRAQLDLTDKPAVDDFFARARPEYVFLAAAKVGGIHANDRYPADFIRENLEIQTNVIDCAYRRGVAKLMFLGSSCIYPREAPQPMTEDCLLTGPLEPTNEWYAVAKIAGIKLCQAYRRQHSFNAIALMPTNLYGPGDNFHPENSHVLPALIRRFHEAKARRASRVTLWGTGNPRREFLHVDDLASAAVFLMERYDGEGIVNVGVGKDISIRELGELVKDVVGYKGMIEFDPSKPDGTPRKLLDVSRIHALGWRPGISLREGVTATYAWYVAQQSLTDRQAATSRG